uniref:Lactate/malate dehydrogenase N-terminal domain-containing protein n=1 Tax=Cucumis sativus TaxID=3659 RepID=A0A0A0KP88_CUCSA
MDAYDWWPTTKCVMVDREKSLNLLLRSRRPRPFSSLIQTNPQRLSSIHLKSQHQNLRGEMLDLQHAAVFLPRTNISASTDYSITAGSDMCIVTDGARQIRNVALFQKIVPSLVQFSPKMILLIVSNLVDVLTYVAWKLSGFPSNRVI